MKLREIRLGLPADGHWLPGCMHHAPDARALVMLMHSGPPLPPLFAGILEVLHERMCATLQLDLLEEGEETRDADAAFNIPHLANRVQATVEWALHQPDLADMNYFVIASGTASAAVIRAAARQPHLFRALVCLGGRPDLAGASPLAALDTPARLIVEQDDPERGIALRAWSALPPGHNVKEFSQQDAPDRATMLTVEWLQRFFPAVTDVAEAHD